MTDPRKLAENVLSRPDYKDVPGERAQTLARELLKALERIDNFERHVEREIEPKLLARAEQAEAERDKYRTLYGKAFNDADKAEAERDRLREAIASALTSLATGPGKDNYAYQVLDAALEEKKS
jgi:hypothetical protein